MLEQIPLTLSGPVLFNGFRVGGAISLPVAAMVRTPLPGAVAADLAILRIEEELLLTILAAALLLASLVRTGRLLRMKSGGLELSLAVAATPRIHSLKVTALRPWLCEKEIRLEKEESQLEGDVINGLAG
jgi:hypothetical protein